MQNQTGETYKAEADWCYWVSESQDPSVHGGYVPSLVRENESGHYPMLGNGKCSAPWIWGKTLAEAARAAIQRATQ